MAIYTNKQNVIIPNGGQNSNAFNVDPNTEFICFLTGFTSLTGTISLQVSLDGGTSWTSLLTGVSAFFQGCTTLQMQPFLSQPGALFRLQSSAAEAAARTMIIVTKGRN